MQRIIPNIWCPGTAAEVGDFYASVFPDTTATVSARYPEEGLPDAQQGFAGRELTVDVVVRDFTVRLINAGDEFRPGPAVSFLVNVDPRDHADEAAARTEIDRLWAALAAGGEVRMPLGVYPHSPYYGWIEDRHGVNWQLILADADDEPSPYITIQLLFTGDEPKARDAIETYTELFGNSGVGLIVPGEDPEWVAFAGFSLTGQWFSAMDAGPEPDFSFTPGVSLQADCADQDEIDRLWELSAVPEAERCGWLVDAYGLSWQIVPADMATLMKRPHAYEHLMGMKKLIIADF